MPNVSDMLRDRLNEIEDEVERLAERLANLRAQAADIKTAQRVIISIRPEDDEGAEFDFNAADRQVGKFGKLLLELDGMDVRRKQKPANVPAVPDMIFKVISDAQDVGFDGLEPRLILKEIQRIWWPDATSESVGPIAWRMSKQGRLVKNGPVYSIPRTESARSVPADLADILGIEPKGGEAT